MNLNTLLESCLALIDKQEDINKFEILYRKYVKLLYQFAKNKLMDEQLTEDAVCLTFIRIAKNMHMIQEPISDKTMHLLLVIENRIIIDISRKKRGKNVSKISLEEMDNLSVEIDTDGNANLTKALSKLPYPYKDVLVLKYAYGYSNKEIACFLELSVANVEKIITRGRKKLKMILEQ